MTDDQKRDNDQNADASTKVASSAPSGPPRNDGASAELQAKCDEYLNGWKRALADYENLQKSTAQNRLADHRRLVVDLAESLLPVIDNFGYVMKHVPDTSTMPPELKKSFDTWFKGIEHIDRQFSDALKSLGVEPIKSLGEKFDPHLHESGGSRKEEGKESGIVVEELIKGWKVGDVVLRPAKVIVNE